MNDVRALILAAGRGTRLGALGERVPKCLVRVGNDVLLDRWVSELADAGVREGLMNTHHLRDLVVHEVARLNASGRLRLRESHEPALLGSAGTVTANRALADGARAVILVYADNVSDVSLRELLAFHDRHSLPGTVLLFRAPDPRACGIATMDAAGTITGFVEKPEYPSSDLANGGVYVFDAELYREVADFGAFDLGRDVLPRLAGRLKGFLHAGYHRDIGTPAALHAAQSDAVTGTLRGGT